MRVLKWVGAAVLGLMVATVAVFLGTRGEYPVHELVTGQPALDSQMVGGVNLHMQVVDGPENARTVIVLHGGPGADFRSLQGLDALADSYRVVLYDQRGAGLSQRVPDDRLDLNHHLQELNTIVDLTSVGQPVVLIGHSWGAMLATAYLGQHPERVHSAVLIEPGFLDAAGRESWHRKSQAYMSGAAYWREAITTGFRAQHVQGPDPEAADDFLIGHMVGVFANHTDNPYHCGAGYSAPNWRFGARTSTRWRGAPDAEVDQIALGTGFDGPVLLLAGACNDWIGAPLQNQHALRFANAEVITIPDAGHDVVWDNPAPTLAAIRGFLKRHRQN